MFNRNYVFSQDKITDMLQFPPAPDIPCELPLVGPFTHDFGLLWQRLTGDIAHDKEGKTSPCIHNPAIHYFQKILANNIFSRGDNGSGNMNELFFIDCVFKPSQVNLATFIIAHMKIISKAKRCNIVIGGVVTSIALAMGLEAEVATLHPLSGIIALNIFSCQAYQTFKTKSFEQYYLMIHLAVIKSIALPWPRRTDV